MEIPPTSTRISPPFSEYLIESHKTGFTDGLHINEAYKILYDEESRARYDIEYQIFDRQRRNHQVKKWQGREDYWNYDYDVKDDNLKEDIESARNYARNLVRDFLKGLKETSKDAAKGAWEGAYGYIIAGVFLTIIFGLIRACI